MIVSPAKAFQASVILGVELDTLSAEELGRAFRDKAKSCHPDKLGPDTAASPEWANISWAKECLTHWLSRHPPAAPAIADGPRCLACGGTGRVKLSTRRFGSPLTVECTGCRGLGVLEELEDDHD